MVAVISSFYNMNVSKINVSDVDNVKPSVYGNVT